MLVDTPGFQNPASCGKQTGASFEDLCHNYLQERLQLLFYHTSLVAPKDRYFQENIELTCEEHDNDNLINPTLLINLLDKVKDNFKKLVIFLNLTHKQKTVKYGTPILEI